MDSRHENLAIEFISVLGLPPVEFVELAADLDCRYIGIALQPFAHANEYPHWSLRDNVSLRRNTVEALRRRGVGVSLGEGFLIGPDKDIREVAADLDLMCELGAQQVNILSVDPDKSRTFDQCATFAELAGDRGLGATLEFMPGLCVGDLDSAAAALRHAGKPNFRLLIDAMHFFRSGSMATQLSTLDPKIIGYVQLCDAPVVSKGGTYADEARFERLPPGDGQLPLLALLTALPEEVMLGIEVPMLARAERGVGPRQRLLGCIQGTLDLRRRAAVQKSLLRPRPE
jgi:sugar phosphate isomerase/epimerase